ncbi:hypothetical protein O3G_MSEX004337 [Manduca sexta]|uniref:Uncharacterized protein n=1 Tax=Manduca sexta TaxID=7130 RepID=A0A922CHD9_MANSE|nr:hypothetical protein O3G_MSEX004337 [Manduca sexta]
MITLHINVNDAEIARQPAANSVMRSLQLTLRHLTSSAGERGGCARRVRRRGPPVRPDPGARLHTLTTRHTPVPRSSSNVLSVCVNPETNVRPQPSPARWSDPVQGLT